MVINTYSHLERRENILQKDRSKCSALQGSNMCAHLMGALHWYCTSNGFFVLCFPRWSCRTSTKCEPSALFWPPYPCVPQKTLARTQPKVLLYPIQTPSVVPLPVPNTKPVRWKSHTGFLFAFSPSWRDGGRMTKRYWFLYNNSPVLRNADKCYISESRVMARAFMLLKAILPKPHYRYLCQKQLAHSSASLDAQLSLSIRKIRECCVPWWNSAARLPK